MLGRVGSSSRTRDALLAASSGDARREVRPTADHESQLIPVVPVISQVPFASRSST